MLFQLDRSIIYDSLKINIPLAVPQQVLHHGVPVVASGWGYTDSARYNRPNTLQTVTLQIVSNDYCQAKHARSIYPIHLCAYGGEGFGVCNCGVFRVNILSCGVTHASGYMVQGDV
uniref:(California timema) hypothetical protein n=1 Tax=Timema californicum TaxID=61474 RepID=A0A7R9JNR4_TIMCA|nr:unnamed protein product [Timema californicum]